MHRKPTRVLIASPVRQEPHVLRLFLQSLERLRQETLHCHFFFIDDNRNEQSRNMLLAFAQSHPHVEVMQVNLHDHYLRDETTHYWSDALVWKVAAFKNAMIQKALDGRYDYLFLVDSDLLLHPQTLEHLAKANKEIVAEIFWTRWQPHSSPQPQVWISDEYTQYRQERGETISEEEKDERYRQFLSMLKKPGLYEVGGLGACTLIHRSALAAGVHFGPIRNLSFWGEDRHFCVRAAALGIPLYVDTHYPAFHIFRDSDVQEGSAFLQQTSAQTDPEPAVTCLSEDCSPRISVTTPLPRLTLSMIVKNEANRYLRQVLAEHRSYISHAVIIDDGSTDQTSRLCQEMLEGIPLHLVKNGTSRFANEIDLRKQQWEETIKTNPEWILNLDADEMFEARFARDVHQLLCQNDVDLFSFRLYDFWNETHYREDRFWRSHFTYRPLLLRYRPDFAYRWRETPLHCGRFPENIFQLPNALSPIRLKHLGWSRREDRLEKYFRYLRLDPEGKYGWKEQYLSILDENPHLLPWSEEEEG